jgi:Lrp/AsnC family transcriptional regulator for asnA, asnC and gidA
VFLQAEGPYLQDVENEIAKTINVTAVYDITGNFDAAVLARFKNQASMNTFIKNTLKIPHIHRTVTNVILNIVKEDPRLRT